MSLFQVDPGTPFQGPHQKQQPLTSGAALKAADTAVILVHGRGASAESMLRFAEEFQQTHIHYRALQAQGHTWYPRSFLAPTELNEPGISSGLQAIHDQITMLNEHDIPASKIVLLGFSQGACLTTEFAARHPRRYGAVIGLSGGLIGDEIDPKAYTGSLEQTPVFLGCSDRDPHIPQERVDITETVFQQLGADIIKRIYKGMGHTVNKDEIEMIRELLTNLNSKN